MCNVLERLIKFRHEREYDETTSYEEDWYAEEEFIKQYCGDT
jgi:hypothetical protein